MSVTRKNSFVKPFSLLFSLQLLALSSIRSARSASHVLLLFSSVFLKILPGLFRRQEKPSLQLGKNPLLRDIFFQIVQNKGTNSFLNSLLNSLLQSLFQPLLQPLF